MTGLLYVVASISLGMVVLYNQRKYNEKGLYRDVEQ